MRFHFYGTEADRRRCQAPALNPYGPAHSCHIIDNPLNWCFPKSAILTLQRAKSFERRRVLLLRAVGAASQWIPSFYSRRPRV